MRPRHPLPFKVTALVLAMTLSSAPLLASATPDQPSAPLAASGPSAPAGDPSGAGVTVVRSVDTVSNGVFIHLSHPLSAEPGYFLYGHPGQGGGVAIDLPDVGLPDGAVAQDVPADHPVIQGVRLVKASGEHHVRALIAMKLSAEPVLRSTPDGILVLFDGVDTVRSSTHPTPISVPSVPSGAVASTGAAAAAAAAAPASDPVAPVGNVPPLLPASTATAAQPGTRVPVPPAVPSEPAVTAQVVSTAGTVDITRLDVTPGVGGNGRIVLGLSDPNAKVDVRSSPHGLVLDVPNAVLPPHLAKHVAGINAGPITQVDAGNLPGKARVVVGIAGTWERSVQQVDRTVIIDVHPLTNDTLSTEKTTKAYHGDKITLNFQNADVRSLLQVIADYSGLNIVASDTVGGQITLRLKDVPWDQALDIILNAKGLDKRQQNNVIWVAPKEEMMTKEKLDLEAKQQIDELTPMVTESFQLNYQKADEARKLLVDQAQRLLSKRGSATVDSRTNTLFVQDAPDRIEAVRALIRKIDVPVRQVLIEARIVEATSTFTKEVGARLGVNQTASAGGTNALIGGSLENTATLSGQTTGNTPSLSQSLGVNLPAASINGASPGALSLILFNSSATKFLNMELSALINDGKGTVLSSPRVVATDQSQAHIEQGTEIPYQQSSGLGSTSIAFKKAVLSLDVKPQITPDGRVIMQLAVNKDSVGQNTTAGPSIDTKQITTQVLVDNGGTVVIGGIYIDTENETVNKIPMLGDLPYLGALFRSKENDHSRQELLVFITPKVVGQPAANLDMDNVPDLTSESIKGQLIDHTLIEKALKD